MRVIINAVPGSELPETFRGEIKVWSECIVGERHYYRCNEVKVAGPMVNNRDTLYLSYSFLLVCHLSQFPALPEEGIRGSLRLFMCWVHDPDVLRT